MNSDAVEGTIFCPVELERVQGQKILRTFCMRSVPLPDMDPHVRVYLPSNFEPLYCESTEGCELLGLASGAMLPFVCRQCVHNELNAIRHRMVFEHGCCDPAWESARRARIWLHDHVLPSGPVDVDIEAWLSHGIASWEARLRKVHARDLVLGKQDFGSKLFVKWEIVLKCPFWGPSSMKARIIMAKTDEFLYLTGPWVHARGLLIKAALNDNYPLCYAAGHTPEEIGKWCHVQEARLRELWGEVAYMDIDCSNYDGSQRLAALLHNKFQRSFFHPPELTEICLDSFQDFKARSFNGIVVSRLCVRNTGGADTSDGNSENGLDTFLGWVMDQFPNEDPLSLFSMVFMGDDNFMVVAPKVLARARENLVLYYGMRGLTAKVNFHRFLWSAEFCSMRFLPNHGTYVLSPKIGRVLSKAFWRLRTSSRTSNTDWLQAITAGLRHDCNHVPVLRGLLAWAERTIGADEAKWAKLMAEDREAAYQFRNVKPLPWDDEAVSWVAALYDVGSDDVRALEYALAASPPGAQLVNHWLLRRISDLDNAPKLDVDHNVEDSLYDPPRHGKTVQDCAWYFEHVNESKRS